MKKQIIILASILNISAFAKPQEICHSVFGAIQLTPDPQCQIVDAYPGNVYLGAQKVADTCFKTVAVGLGTGFSGLTMEVVFGVDRVQTVTPNMLNEKDAPTMPNRIPQPMTQTRQMFTGRTVLTTRYGKLYGAEAGAMSVKGSAEQAIIVGGTGRYKNASGYLYAFGDFIGVGKWGTYTGQICVPY